MTTEANVEDRYTFDVKGIVVSKNPSSANDVFKGTVVAGHERIIPNGVVYEVNSAGVILRTLAVIGIDGRFSFVVEGQARQASLFARIVSPGYTTMDFDIMPNVNREQVFEMPQLHTPLYNTGYSGVSFTHWYQDGGDKQIIFREDGIAAFYNPRHDKWGPTRVKSSYSETAKGFHLSTKKLSFFLVLMVGTDS